MAFKTVNDMVNVTLEGATNYWSNQSQLAYAIFIQVFCRIGKGDDLWPEV